MRKLFVTLLTMTFLLSQLACSKSAPLKAQGGAEGESKEDINTETSGGLQSPRPDINTESTGGDQGRPGMNKNRRRRP